MPSPQEQLGEGAQAPETADQLGGLHQTVEATSVQEAVQTFIDKVKEGGKFDFKGEHDSADELEQNSAFKRIITELEKFLKENAEKNPDAPKQYFSAWMDATTKFLRDEIKSYDWSLGAMEIDQAEATIDSLKDPNKTGPRTETPGIGSFEEWFGTNYPAEYKNWITGKEQKKEAAESLSNKKEELIKRAGDLEQKFSQMTSTPEIEKNKQELADLKTKIPGASDLAALAVYETILVALEGSKIEYEKQAAEKAKAEATAEKERQEQAAKAAEAKKAEAEAALDAQEEQDAPIADKLLNFAKRLPEDSPFKSLLTTIAGALVSIGAGMANWPLIGPKIRGTFISNKLLDEKGDKVAKEAIKTERLFRKYGLDRVMANELGAIPASETIKVLVQEAAKIKPEEISDETDKKTAQGKKDRITNLVNLLKEHGGENYQKTLFEFVSEKNLETSVAQTPTAPPTAPAPAEAQSATPSVVPAAAAATATAPIATTANKPPEKPAENPETKLIQATNKELEPFNNRTIDLTEQTFAFRLPYLTQSGAIEYSNCSIKGNNFDIGGHKYTLELPHSANLQKLTIEDPVQTGTTELVAGKFGFSDSKEIPLATLLKNLEALRKEPKDRTISMGSDSATFKYLA